MSQYFWHYYTPSFHDDPLNVYHVIHEYPIWSYVLLCLIFIIRPALCVDEENNPDTITFNDFLESFGLINYTTFFTHTAKHILDLVISNDSTLVYSVLPGHVLSDHLFVHATLKIVRPFPPQRTVRYRK